MPFISNELLTKTQVVNGIEYSNLFESSSNHVSVTNNTNIIISVDTEQNIKLNSLDFSCFINGKNESNKYWNFTLFEVSDSYSLISLWTDNSSQFKNYFKSVNTIDIYLNNLFTNTIFFMLRLEKIGNPGSISVASKLIYQHYKAIN